MSSDNPKDRRPGTPSGSADADPFATGFIGRPRNADQDPTADDLFKTGLAGAVSPPPSDDLFKTGLAGAFSPTPPLGDDLFKTRNVAPPPPEPIVPAAPSDPTPQPPPWPSPSSSLESALPPLDPLPPPPVPVSGAPVDVPPIAPSAEAQAPTNGIEPPINTPTTIPPQPARNLDPFRMGPGDSFDGFQIIDRIGEGGMGVVYRAARAGMDVAIKLIRPGFEQTLENEYRTAMRVGQHPGLLHIRDFRSEPHAYLVMEFLDGDDLETRRLQQGGRLAADAWLWDRLEQAAQALDHLHAAGLVHGDIKPENIHVLRDEQRTKLIDYGVARRLRASDTATTAGTPAFIAPECLEATSEVTRRSDLYSFALVVVRLLSGRMPFAHDLEAAREWHLRGDRRDLGLEGPFANGLTDVLSTALSVRPEDRPASATALVVQLRSVDAGAPTETGEGPADSFEPVTETAQPTPRMRPGEERRIATLREYLGVPSNNDAPPPSRDNADPPMDDARALAAIVDLGRDASTLALVESLRVLVRYAQAYPGGIYEPAGPRYAALDEASNVLRLLSSRGENVSEVRDEVNEARTQIRRRELNTVTTEQTGYSGLVTLTAILFVLELIAGVLLFTAR